MSKKKFRQNKSVSGGVLCADALKRQLENALSDGRVRKAFLLAKELIAQRDVPSVLLSLAAKAVERKMLQMHREGASSQIGMMLNAVLVKAPGIRELMHPEYIALMHWNDAAPSYFQNYESIPAVKEQLDAYVRRLLPDPRELSAHKHLQNNHSLKRTADLITKVWIELERGDSSGLEALNSTVGRHSPFVAWRLLLNGLNCFYAGDSKSAEENLVRIESDSPLSRLAYELIGLIRNKAHADSDIQRRIKRATNGGTLSAAVAALETNLEKNLSDHRRQELLYAVFTDELREKRPVLYYNLGVALHLMVGVLPNREAWFKALSRLKDQFRMIILTRHVEHMESICDWLYLSDQECFTKQERALIYDWLATLVSLRLHPPGRKPAYITIPKERASELYREMENYWEKSISLFPLVQSYSKWHQMSESFLTAAQSDKILERWHNDFPHDENVLFKLLESARKRKVYTRAASHLKRLTELAPNHPGLVRSRELLQLEQVLSSLGKGHDAKARALTGQLEPSLEIFISGFQNFVKIVCRIPGAASRYPLLEEYFCRRAMDNKFALPSGTPFTFRWEELDAEEFFTEFESIFTISDPVWGNARLTAVHYPKNGLKHLERISSERLWNFCRLFPDRADQFRYGYGILDFLWKLTSEGLSRQDNWTGAFLLLRAFLLLSVSHFTRDRKIYEFLREKIINILAVSSKYLRKAGIFEPLKNVSEYLESLYVSQSEFTKKTDCFGRHEARKIVEVEIGSRLDSLVRKNSIPEASSYYEERREYPCLLSNYCLLPDDAESDFDDDNFDFIELEKMNLSEKLQVIFDEAKASGISMKELARKFLQEMERTKQ